MNELVKVENGVIIANEQDAEIFANALETVEKFELRKKEAMQNLKDFMEETGNYEPIKIGRLKFSYRKGTTRTTIDSKRLKEECLDVYEEYSKTSPIASSITLTIED